MGLLKEDLKTAKGLLKDGKNEEVVELLEEHIKNGVQDYFLFIFSGLANSNSENYVDGYQMYRKAVILDDSKGDAWKGLYKLIEGDGKVKAEQFDLEICEKMKTFVPDKISEIEKTSHRILFQLRDWKNLSSLDFSSDFAPKIINLLAPKIIKLEDSEREIVAKSFNLIEETFENDLELVAIYCKFVQGDQRIPTLVKFYSKLPEPWILAELSIFVYEQYFETGKFPDFSGIFENPLIAHLQSQNITEALQIVDKLPAEAKVIYPEALLYVELLAESENWAQCETTVRSILNNTKNENVKSTCFNWISRIVLESDQDIKKLSSLPLKRPKFFIEEVKTSLIQGIPVKTNDKKEELLVKLLSALYNKNVTENEKNIVESFLKLPELDWKDLLLAAEIKLALEIDATTLLVKAAKLNPRSSRVFFVLGKSLITKNPTKSRACLERAVKIQPGNEEYVKQLDDVLISQNATATERLVHLNKLVQIRENRRKSAWLTDVLSVLYLETNNYDLAIEELQHMVRLYQDNKLAWARLANAYFKKGHLRASVSSYEHLAELENGHRYTIPMIRVLIQLREFETSLEKILEYREKFGNSEEDESCRIALDTLEAQIRLNLMNDTFGEERRTHLRESLKVLNRSLSSEESSNYSIVYKLIGDSLLKVSEYQTRFYDFFEMNPNWKVVDQLSCIKLSVTFYSVVLKLRKDDALAWHDFSVSIMRQYKIEKNPELLTKSNSFIKHAIKLTKDESLLSTLWTLLAENLRLSDEPANRILHCLTRALQLNKINDVAWLELAILCLANGDMENSSRCLEQAIKYNPHNGEAWCTWAQHAHLQGAAYDATVMYRQALCIRVFQMIQNTRSSILLPILFLLLLVEIANGLQCYDCYGTGPDHKECTQQRSCNGVACMIFDAGDNQTASAFCLLAMKGQKLDEAKDGCWLEPDGKGKHCMCFSDFCNKLVDRRNTDESDPMAPLLPTADFLKQNPLVDYDSPNLGDYVDDGSHPPPSHVLFPSADKPDPRVAGSPDTDDDDLVAVNLDEYDEQEAQKAERHRYHHHNNHHSTTPSTSTTTDDAIVLPVDDNSEDDTEDRTKLARVPENRDENIAKEVSSSFKPPAWVLFFFPMAASWARFVTSF